MFSKIASLVLLGLAAITFAAPGGDHTTTTTDCNTGTVQCCQQVHAPGDYDVSKVAALVGVATSAISGQVGAQCNPISVLGVGTGGNCAASTVCCKGYDQASLVAFNCNNFVIQG